MSMSLPSAGVSDPFIGILATLRAKIRQYIVGEGLFAGLAWLAAAFWITLAIDWSFEPPWEVRGLMLAGVAGVLGYLLYRYWFRRWSVPVTDNNLAVLLERRYGDFRDSLITTVELEQNPAHAKAFHPDMLLATRAAAAGKLENVRLGNIFDTSPLLQKGLLALFLGGAVAAFAALAAEPFQIWVQRCLLLSNELWPRKTALEIEGFPNKVKKIGRGGECLITVKADSTKVVPETVEIRYEYKDGTRERQRMEPGKVTGTNEPKYFTFKLTDLKQSVDFEIRGGDARLSGYKIEVVDNPTFNERTLVQIFPAYMRRANQELKPSDAAQIRQATQVTLRTQANKPLRAVAVERTFGEKKDEQPPVARAMNSDATLWEIPLGSVNADQLLFFRLTDTDDIEGREPIRLSLGVIPDEAPKVGLRLIGIGNAITTQAKLPIVGSVEDDYGLQRVWIEYQLDQSADVRQRDLQLPATTGTNSLDRLTWDRENNADRYKEYADEKLYLGLDLKQLQEAAEAAAQKAAAPPAQPEQPLSPATDPAAKENAPAAPPPPPATANTPSKFALKIGQKLLVATKATDNSTLENGPFLGTGERYTLEIVSPEQLAAMLEAREVGLRQRFEKIIEEFTVTRDDLYAIQFQPSGKKPDIDLEDEPADPNDKRPMLTPEEETLRLKLERTELSDRTLEKLERSAFETATLAAAFLEILDEFENNRMNTEQNDKRLRRDIAEPLQAIADLIVPPEPQTGSAPRSASAVPTLKDEVQRLRALINDIPQGTAQQKECVKLADEIIVKMKLALDKMLELEDYNQLLSKLRKLIDDQNKIIPETKTQQKKKLLEGN